MEKIFSVYGDNGEIFDYKRTAREDEIVDVVNDINNLSIWCQVYVKKLTACGITTYMAFMENLMTGKVKSITTCGGTIDAPTFLKQMKSVEYTVSLMENR